MNWTQINEEVNLFAVFLGIFPMITALYKYNKNKWVKFIFFFFLAVTFLDVIVFYHYKFLDNTLHWIGPYYVFNVMLFIPLFLYFSNENTVFKRIIVYSQGFLLIIIVIRMLFFTDFTSYDEWTWLSLQINFQILTLTSLFFEFKKTNKPTARNPLVFINVGLLIIFFVPMLSSLLQKKLYEASPDYYQMSLLVLNSSSVLGYTLILKGLTLVKSR